MRMIIGVALVVTTASSALSADLGYRPRDVGEAVFTDEVSIPPPRRVTVVRRTRCTQCPGSHLPLGGLRTTYQARLPLGGLGRYCPPELQTRQVVLVRKG